jgi:hypothetical protein
MEFIVSLNKSILLASLIIAASISAHLAYTVRRDGRIEQERRAEKQREEQLAVEAYRKAEGKAAWDAATQDLPDELDRYVVDSPKIKFLNHDWDFVTLKNYEHSDVSWIGPRQVQLAGYIEGERWFVRGPGHFDPLRQWFQWRRSMRKTDEGGWGGSGAAFTPVNLTPEQIKDWFVRPVRIPEAPSQ